MTSAIRLAKTLPVALTRVSTRNSALTSTAVGAFKSSSIITKRSASTTTNASSQSPKEEDNNSTDAQDLERYKKYALDTYGRPPVILEHGKGSIVYDTNGKKYIDFTAGIAVNALGHADPGVAEVLTDQSTKLIHLSNLYFNQWSGRLAETLVNATLAGSQESGDKKTGLYADINLEENKGPKVFFTNSGTEANEGAIKFARKYGKVIAKSGKMGSGVTESLKVEPNLKYGLVSFTSAFHGRSLGALSLTPNPKYQDPFTPLIPGVVYAKYNKPYEVAAMIDERTCAVIVEPLQGEGGIHVANVEFLRALRRRCDQVKAVLIYDEIQCGMGRTGKFWAHHHYPADCAPDIITLAKPLANGIPIGGIIMSQTIADIINVGDHGTTFGGNPLACRVGHHVASRIAKQEFMQSVSDKGKFMVEQAKDKLQPYFESGLITEIRGSGLLLGLQISQDPAPIVSAALKKGLLLVSAGGNTIRLVPPLVIEKEEIEQGLSILASVLKEL